MPERDIHAVTGAFGFSGKYIAKRLLDKGRPVITLTNSPHRHNPFSGKVTAYPFNFDNPAKLRDTLAGVRVLYNTYWVRFNYKTFQYAEAIRNTLALFQAAKEAGVERIVHVSITNPAKDSPLEYFSGKAELEEALHDSGLSYAILRPAVLFGKEGILINNIAWTLRRFPFFVVFGDGNYRLQPIHVDDLAALAERLGENQENTTVNAIGPETFTYRQLVETIGGIIGRPRPILSVPPSIGYFVASLIGKLMHDVMVTHDEIEGLMADLLHVEAPPAGTTKLTDWVKEHADTLGRRYASELARRRDRVSDYKDL